MILATSITIILSLIGAVAMIFAATLTVLDVRKLQNLERQIKNDFNVNNAEDYQDFQYLGRQLTELKNQLLKLDNQGKKRLMYGNEDLIREAQEKIEFYVNVKPAMKKKLTELLRQESDLGKIDYMIKIIKLLLIKV